ncbi:hypothetical protein NSP_23390 [Nodularia spumigena CCY9414]|nr:hypothetical protein NSP_23390 [Nodularia spumigena CCY9414]
MGEERVGASLSPSPKGRGYAVSEAMPKALRGSFFHNFA